jgi:ribosomal-protein-alanine N-acetyltransferase
MDVFPILKTERLVLREFRLNDAPAVLDILSRDEVTRFLNISSLQSLERAERIVKARISLFADQRGLRWAIALRDKPDVVIGSCGFYYLNRAFHSCEIGYDLHLDYWRQGYMTEALTAILDFAYSDRFFFELNRIEALTYPYSEASIALLNKLGFVDEGLRRDYAYWEDQFHDLRCFSLLRRDWEDQT